MKTRPYIIVTPAWSGRDDVRVLHTLCHELNALGFDASLLLTAQAAPGAGPLLGPGLNTPVMNGLMDRHWADLNEEAIVVYAGDVQGNPFGAKRVIRYVMAKEAPDTEAPADEYRVYLSKSYPAKRQVFKRVLCLLPLDLGVFHAKGVTTRDQDMLWLGPDVQLEGEPPKQLVSLTDSWPASAEERADQLRRTRHLHSYQPGALVNFEAALCGAVVILRKFNGSTATFRPDLELHETGSGGLAFSDTAFEIERAARTRQELIENLRYQQASFRQRLLDFVSETQLHFYK